MTFVLDTDILSALRRQERNGSVQDWVRTIDETELFVSDITLGEVRRGIEMKRVTAPFEAMTLEAGLLDTEDSSADRVLAIERRVADMRGA